MRKKKKEITQELEVDNLEIKIGIIGQCHDSVMELRECLSAKVGGKFKYTKILIKEVFFIMVIS